LSTPWDRQAPSSLDKHFAATQGKQVRTVQPNVVERQIGAQTLRIETGKLAKQAHGAVFVRLGDTTVLTAVVEAPARAGVDFFPLTVDYREKMYAAGKFPGGYKKREGPPSTKEILTMRLTDRPIRPLFPKGYGNEIQIMTSVLSADRDNDPDVLSIIGASAALHVSPVPFLGPIGAVRIGRVNKQLIALPTYLQLEEGDLDLVVAGTQDAVCMIEGFGKELPENEMADAIKFAHEQIRTIVAMQRELRTQVGLGEVHLPPPPDDALYQRIREKYYEEVKAAKQTPGKLARAAAVESVRDKVVQEFVSTDPMGEPTLEHVESAFYWVERQAVRDLILSGVRPDDRPTNAVRSLYSEAGVLPRTHGSALFQRGETQALVIATLGGPLDEQKVDGLHDDYSKRFMLDYNMPPFAVGECRPIRGPGRREIGHGALAERSLEPVLPSPDRFPYTLRLVSEILESNGSSSMASVCAGTLCLMDAGVPIKDPVAGVSIGLVKEDDRHVLLTDIMGDEDHFGDMDFKIAGTQRGITGIQLDLKIPGISEDLIRETLQQARAARIQILRHMLSTLPRPRKELSPFAPRLMRLKIAPDKIGALIGPGGKNIRALEEQTRTKVAIEDDGTVTITGAEAAKVEEAFSLVEAIGEDVKVGKIYKGRVCSVTDFGAFVEIVPGREGLCHISELDHGYVSRVTDICKVGDVIDVQVISIDAHDRVKLSRKVLLKKN
jgi:polyribonucleotide nucleotidyltransferase